MDIRAPDQRYNPYRIFSREQWAALRNDTPMTLEPGEFDRLRSLHDRLDLKEVEDIYLPLSRLLSIYVDAAQRLYSASRPRRACCRRCWRAGRRDRRSIW
jgi:type I pantothenate kinase